MQKAADYAHTQNRLGGDYCGRYAWAQGPITDTNQYYPRDFNLVALSGNVDSLRDIDGPIAVKGNATIKYFHLNIARLDGIALLAGGNVALTSGTVNGSVQYGGTYAGQSITFVDAPFPLTHANPSRINFDTAKTTLVTMSQAVRDHYTVNGTTDKPYNTLNFSGTDPELNVFRIDQSQLDNTTGYTFNVPLGSAMVVTVTGQSPAFRYAGFSGTYLANKMLWNFPDATTLTITGVAVPGSILAPNAAANLTNGSIRGTVVVGSASPAFVELYSAPFRLACTGCLCLDKHWSCSSDTVMADDGTAADIASEAGFLEIEGGTYRSEGYDRTSPTHRVWYSFHPAKSGRKDKPLAVFFNGGPGSATTPFLFAFNTGPTTVDPQVTGGITYNPNSWTQVANLLYIDAPATGFSYPLRNADMSKPDLGTDLDRDASNFLRVIVRFLARHPALQKNRVILVGESYGGIRASLMLKHLYDYAALTEAHASEGYRDLQLSDELAKYFNTSLLTTTPAAAQIATRFGHQVLIEPALVGTEQVDAFYTLTNPPTPPQVPHYDVNAAFPMQHCKPPFPDDPTPCWTARSEYPDYGIPARTPSCDAYNCDKADKWSGDLGRQAATKLTKTTTLSTALNVNVRSIAWMNDGTRKAMAYGRASDSDFLVEAATPVDLDSPDNFDALNTEDNYLVLQNLRVNMNYGWVKAPYPPGTPPRARDWLSPGMGWVTGAAFANNVRNGVKSFITVALYDACIWTPSIPAAFLVTPETPLAAVSYEPNSPNICSTNNNGLRPGAMYLMYDSFPNGHEEVVSMPGVYYAGHTVPMRAPADLLTDVSLWYRY